MQQNNINKVMKIKRKDIMGSGYIVNWKSNNPKDTKFEILLTDGTKIVCNPDVFNKQWTNK